MPTDRETPQDDVDDIVLSLLKIEQGIDALGEGNERDRLHRLLSDMRISLAASLAPMNDEVLREFDTIAVQLTDRPLTQGIADLRKTLRVLCGCSAGVNPLHVQNEDGGIRACLTVRSMFTRFIDHQGWGQTDYRREAHALAELFGTVLPLLSEDYAASVQEKITMLRRMAQGEDMTDVLADTVATKEEGAAV